MMLAISATGALTLIDPAVLKRAPSSAPSCISLTETTVSSTWSSDNAFLFLASSQTLHKYDPSSNSLKELYSSKDEGPICQLVSKDKGTLIYSTAEKIHMLECGSIPKISQTLESHKTPVNSLSISNDGTLLASTCYNAVHVHNLTLGSHTALRGLALAGQTITTSSFHPHARTRLLLGIGKQLVVYDTTRPSGPLKTIPLNETTSGDIIAVACSPFSKTLVAVATTGGYVSLIDLEKEKALFRTLNLKVPLTSLGFSPEGAAIYCGTEHGKLLITDLRALDKPPKSITISDVGCRIETMSVQRKVKSGLDTGVKPTPVVANTKPSTQAETNPSRRPSAPAQALKAGAKTVPSPAHARVTRVDSTASPARRVPSTLKEPPRSTRSTPKKPMVEPEKKKVFSPVRDPLGNSGGDISVEIETLNAMRGPTKLTPLKGDSKPSVRPRPSASPRVSSGPSSISAASATSRRTVRETAEKETDPPRRARTVPTASRVRTKASMEPVVAPDARLTVPGETLQDGREIRSRSRAASSASRAGSDSISAASARSARPGSSASRPGSSISRASSSPIPPVPPLPKSRTPSPDLPDMDMNPVTPIPAMKKNRIGVLGLGTPEVDQWIRAGKGEGRQDRKGKGKTVGFKYDESDAEESEEAAEKERERERSLTMQVSPRRPGVGASASWEPSPLRRSMPGSPAVGGSSAHDLLRTIVQDVMYDFQRETKAEMTGLHLDLVRMGRGWKRELRDLMEEYVGGLNDLKEENRRLREENELLRRGF